MLTKIRQVRRAIAKPPAVLYNGKHMETESGKGMNARCARLRLRK